MVRIALPDFKRAPDAKAHPYPLQIALQAQQFLLGAVFHATIRGFCAREYVSAPDSMAKLKDIWTSWSGDEDTWRLGWEYLERYMDVFRQADIQDVLIYMNSHWDWYIRKVGCFVDFAREHVDSPQLKPKQLRQLRDIGRTGILDQLNVLETATGLSFNVSEADEGFLREMALLRNIGLHNRWEVDSYYADRTETGPWQIGELRTFGMDDLYAWRGAFDTTLRTTSTAIAVKYVGAPEYVH